MTAIYVVIGIGAFIGLFTLASPYLIVKLEAIEKKLLDYANEK